MNRIRTLMQKRGVSLACFSVSAVLTALAVCFPILGIFEWVSLIPLGFALYTAAEKEKFSFAKAYFSGFGFFMAYYVVIFHWFFYMYPLDFLGLSAGAAAVVVVVACLGLALLQAVVSALIFPLFLVVARGRAAKKYPLVAPFAAAALWCVVEWSYTLTWAGVPWSRLALGQMEMLGVVQTASLFGSYFITFLIVAVNFLLAYGFFYRRRFAVALPMLLFALNLTVGGILLVTYRDTGESIRVAAVQGNVSSKDKWDDDSLIDSLLVYTEYTQQAADRGATLIIWPESVIPHAINELPTVDSYLRTLAKTTDAHVFVGGFEKKDGLNYNSIYAYAPDGTLNDTTYSKRHLVPFGEFLPMEDFVRTFIPPLAELNAFSNTLEPGEGSNIIKTDAGNIGCIICFDSIYEDLVRDSVRDGAQLIAVSTNDSWFSDSEALYMHNRQAALRAIESGRYVVRAANTGISSVISPTGEVMRSLGALEEGYITADVYLRDGQTLYMRMGNIIVWLSIAFYLSLLSYGVCGRGRSLFEKSSAKTFFAAP